MATNLCNLLTEVSTSAEARAPGPGRWKQVLSFKRSFSKALCSVQQRKEVSMGERERWPWTRPWTASVLHVGKGAVHPSTYHWLAPPWACPGPLRKQSVRLSSYPSSHSHRLPWSLEPLKESTAKQDCMMDECVWWHRIRWTILSESFLGKKITALSLLARSCLLV